MIFFFSVDFLYKLQQYFGVKGYIIGGDKDTKKICFSFDDKT